METMFFVVVRLDGDYAVLRRTDTNSPVEIPLARALLPQEIEEGTKLQYENFEYTCI